MPTAVKFVPRSPAECWQQFTDVAALTGWVPGLRRVRVVASYPDGLVQEAAFEFAASRTYSLVYQYDHAARTVSWAPRIGQRDAVRGSARFEVADHGTLVSYETDGGVGRSGAEREIDDPALLLDGFARWMDSRPVAR